MSIPDWLEASLAARAARKAKSREDRDVFEAGRAYGLEQRKAAKIAHAATLDDWEPITAANGRVGELSPAGIACADCGYVFVAASGASRLNWLSTHYCAREL